MEATHNALADAGLTKSDVDAVFTSGRNMANDVPEYLGIRPRFIGGTQVGGCSFILHVEHAMAAINAGLCEVALITHGESGYSRIAMPAPRWGDDSTNTQFELVLRQLGPADRLRLPGHAPHARVRHHQASRWPRSRWRRASGRRSIPRRSLRDPITDRRRARARA